MPTYQCSYMDENDKIVRTEVFRASSDLEARREAMTRMIRVGGFSRYELFQPLLPAGEGKPPR